jgi:uncharacterized protein DUF4129
MSEDQAIQRLSEILARPEYHVDQSPPWWEQLLGPVWDLVWSLIARLVVTLLDAARGDAGWYGWGVIALCVVLFALVGVYLVRAVRLSVRADARLATASVAERQQRSDQLWRTAQQLAAAGELREAVRLMYLSALYALDERAFLHVDSSMTNREHARRLHSLHPRLGDSFAEVVDRYDRVRYGRAPVTAEVFAELAQRAERVRDVALHAPGTAA